MCNKSFKGIYSDFYFLNYLLFQIINVHILLRISFSYVHKRYHIINSKYHIIKFTAADEFMKQCF